LQKLRYGPDPLVVLVVEDEVLLRLEIVDYLRNAGCIVLEAWSANEAIAMCRNGEPVDILVTDINLCGPRTGWEIAEALRALQPGAGVVYVSGNSVDHSRRVVGSLFFKKPYSALDILEACRDLA
jgi:two-component system, response regulator PdtaR